MRLLYVIDSLAPGGAETSLVEMTPHLIAAGIDLHVLPLGERLDLSGRLQRAGAIVHERESRRGRLGNVQAVTKVARKTSPDLIHTTLYEADIAGRIASLRLGLPTSASVVGDSYGAGKATGVSRTKLGLAKAFDRVTGRRVARFHAVSLSIAEAIERDLHVPRERIEVIPRGRSASEFPFHTEGVRRSVRDSLGVPHHAPTVLTVGRLEPVKGLDLLMTALPRVARAHQDMVVLIAGMDGRAASSLRAVASSLPIDIRFLGHRNDVANLLTAADVLCFPSLSEGSPGVLIEALAVGCPIVATDISANREVLGMDGATFSALTEVGDHDSLARSLMLTLSKTHDSDNARAKGRFRFEEYYEINTVAKRMITFFEAASEHPQPVERDF